MRTAAPTENSEDGSGASRPSPSCSTIDAYSAIRPTPHNGDNQVVQSTVTRGHFPLPRSCGMDSPARGLVRALSGNLPSCSCERIMNGQPSSRDSSRRCRPDVPRGSSFRAAHAASATRCGSAGRRRAATAAAGRDPGARGTTRRRPARWAARPSPRPARRARGAAGASAGPPRPAASTRRRRRRTHPRPGAASRYPGRPSSANAASTGSDGTPWSPRR